MEPNHDAAVARVAALIDATLLQPTAVESDILALCQEAIESGARGVCVHSSWLPTVVTQIKDRPSKAIAVVGFPTGASATEVKVAEAKWCEDEGADELDMVVNLGLVKSGQWEKVRKDLGAVISSVQIPVKVIFESHLLSPDELIQLCAICDEEGAAFVKTSTGFTGGARKEDVALMREHFPRGVKASGGVRTYSDLKIMVDAGANCVGTSSCRKILADVPKKVPGSFSEKVPGTFSFIPGEIIKKKRRGQSHTAEEIKFVIEQFTSGELPDYQMAAWLMAVFFQGMTSEETSLLTEQMLRSGRQLDFSGLAGPAVDKHSTGGVGDKTSLILAPLVAAAGVPVPMIAGRGLGHTGGTLDKLEAIPGFNIHLDLQKFTHQVEQVGTAIIGQTEEICPADKRIYALRDVTATVESLPLICASIMSKKLAEGIQGLVLDVKYGSGAFMKTTVEALALAEGLCQIGQHRGVKVRALITNMEQPLGRYIGNSLEVIECLQILRQESRPECALESLSDCQELTLRLAAEMIHLGGKAASPQEGYKLAHSLLVSGRALEKFEEVCKAQGGNLKALPSEAPLKAEWLAPEDGYVSAIDVEKVGLAALELGAGRFKTTDSIDPVAGIFIHHKLGSRVQRGQPLATLYASDSNRLKAAEKTLAASYKFSLNEFSCKPLVHKVLGS